MAIEELNIKLIWEYDGTEVWEEDDQWVPVCPTSAHSGIKTFWKHSKTLLKHFLFINLRRRYGQSNGTGY